VEHSRKVAPKVEAPVEEPEDDEPQVEEISEVEAFALSHAAPEEPVVMPSVRNTDVEAKKRIDFTEKKFAHLPARESHVKEAPYPKSKKIEKKNDIYIDIEDKDPIWLKDKGDHFYNRNDFVAGIRAYGRALEEDKDFLTSQLNRATCFLRVRGFGATIEDCNEIHQKIDNMKQEDRDEDGPFYNKIYARAHVKRAAAYTWTSEFDKALADFKAVIETEKYACVFNPAEIEAFKTDCLRIE